MSAAVEPLRILGMTRAEFRKMARGIIDEVLQEPDMQERLREAGYRVRPSLVIVPHGKPHGA
jgi:hypothetical protein